MFVLHRTYDTVLRIGSTNQMTTEKSTQGVAIPLENALCRFSASFLTWPVEKSKLIFQAEGFPVFSRLLAISVRSHLHGALGEKFIFSFLLFLFFISIFSRILCYKHCVYDYFSVMYTERKLCIPHVLLAR